MQELIIASHNEGKVEEIRKILSDFGVRVRSLADLDQQVPDVEETGTTFEENAQLKASSYAAMLNMPVLADDSGLEIDALDGRPGVFSARYAGEEKNDENNLQKVLTEMDGVKNRSARFVTVLALVLDEGTMELFRGECEGTITTSPVGENGFGYDPIFTPKDKSVTMAQLTKQEKNAISHRGHALDLFKHWLSSRQSD
ncbi:deoxyribonucleotide triphosphate pyrophosphatase [Pontibacillus halophilus JSM 076056 = DSM 19796]|uniref:dITP/XTP pyrophosphatase n=1 Tax=Pontibacillus halophilus JSM 076056 = DSM 19796 TaxID=1385510 RepID=A0A0A5GQK6_9BACI|nr:XTP/dITP diphosphatase [Pontibacillus halophilus]KGX93450.1 deoxyribonucleotide triphosphate pyrophosphatase [Pontibacillus halophilus JSM 076056 = DSM 19796]